MSDVALAIVRHLEKCLELHGDSARGVDWPTREGAERSYAVMLGVIRERPPATPSLLDLGCGLAHMYEYMIANGWNWVEYRGSDLSERFLDRCRQKFPHIPFSRADILGDSAAAIPEADYVVMDGLLTEKLSVPFDEMWRYSQALIAAAFGKARRGIAFNVKSKYVDWEREDLFHVPVQLMTDFIAERLTRSFVIRHDYGLYEYTVYAYRD
jgi:SAM-dependent methyltransferase